MRYLFYSLAITSFLSVFFQLQAGLAASTSDKSPELALEYPELTVVPRASDRLKDEAIAEKGNGWYNQRMLLTSAALTLASGLIGTDSLPDGSTPEARASSQTMGSTATFVGLAWIVAGTWLATKYEPYHEGWKGIQGLKSSTQKEQLHRERLAEEALSAPASLGRKIMIMSVVSNLAVNLGVASTSGADGRQIGTVAALAAFAPLLFPYHWQLIESQHQLYKKKIYGPIVQNSLLMGPQGQILPSLALDWKF
jgi:hypothetical protein